MLLDIKKNSVDWKPAYTDEEDEPVYLPGLIPNLLVNGTSGIAVGMACSFAPHNLNEIMDSAIFLLENPKAETKELLNFIKGPDFPTGGLLINADELPQAYLTGKGRARVRGEYVIESKKDKESIVFTSIPYKVSKENLIIEIDKLCEEKKIDGIVSIRDESNKDGVRFVIELGKGVSSSVILTKLFKMSRLEDTYSFNQVALVNKVPKLLNLKDLLEIYIAHQKDVLKRITNFDLEKVKARIHILEGLLIALEDIDNVIKLIKISDSAKSAKEELIKQYNLTEIQAKSILDMKLSKLAKLEKIEIKKEKEDLKQKEEELNQILDNPIPKMIEIFKNIKNKYGDSRRTTITQAPKETEEEKEIEFIEPEKCVVVLTESGYIKRIPTISFKTQRRNGKGIKSQDDITNMVLRTNTIDSLMVFTTKGKMYRLLVDNIPIGTNSSKGQSIKDLINMDNNEKVSVIYSIYRDTEAQFVFFATKKGLIKKTKLDEYIKTKRKTGIAAISLKEDDELVSVCLIKDEPIILLTKNGTGIRFNSNNVGVSSRVAYGIKGIDLKENDCVVSALPIRDLNDDLAIFSENGLSKKIDLKDLPAQNRGGKGLICYKVNGSTGNVVNGALISEEDRILLCGDKNSICISARDIPLLSRTSVGAQSIKNNFLLSVSKV